MSEYIQQPCQFCGKPMQVALGTIKPIKNKLGQVEQVQMPNQTAKYHGACRKEARKAEHKREKLQRRYAQPDAAGLYTLPKPYHQQIKSQPNEKV